MGMFDSLNTECPKCGNDIEFQSKSGECLLTNYNKKFPLSAQVAVGMNGDIVRCQFCKKRIRLECNLPLNIKFKLVITKGRKFDYEGNYNPKHPYSIKKGMELARILNKPKRTVKTGENKNDN